MKMNNKFILTFAFMFLVAAAMADAAILAPEVTTFLIKPDKVFAVGDMANLSLHVVSNVGPINFSANITLIEGSTTGLNNFDITSKTGVTLPCTLFTCVYDNKWPFQINSLPVTYRVVVTQINDDGTTGTQVIINATTKKDADGDGYYSVETGGNDCLDTNAAVHPGASEVCGNSLDDDCSAGDATCAVPPSGDSGSGGHSSGGAVSGAGGSGRLLTDTYTCLGNKNIIVTPNDKIEIKYKNTNYTLFVKDILPNSVLVKVYPIPSRNLQVTQGDSKSFDLDWNNQNDFKLNVLATRTNTNANISCDIIPEKAVKEQEKPKEEPKTIPEIISNIKEGVLSIASEIVPKEKASPVVGGVLALAIVVIGLLGYSIYSRRKSSKDEF
jgi:hypothetical protein